METSLIPLPDTPLEKQQFTTKRPSTMARYAPIPACLEYHNPLEHTNNSIAATSAEANHDYAHYFGSVDVFSSSHRLPFVKDHQIWKPSVGLNSWAPQKKPKPNSDMVNGLRRAQLENGGDTRSSSPHPYKTFAESSSASQTQESLDQPLERPLDGADSLGWEVERMQDGFSSYCQLPVLHSKLPLPSLVYAASEAVGRRVFILGGLTPAKSEIKTENIKVTSDQKFPPPLADWIIKNPQLVTNRKLYVWDTSTDIVREVTVTGNEKSNNYSDDDNKDDNTPLGLCCCSATKITKRYIFYYGGFRLHTTKRKSNGKFCIWNRSITLNNRCYMLDTFTARFKELKLTAHPTTSSLYPVTIARFGHSAIGPDVESVLLDHFPDFAVAVKEKQKKNAKGDIICDNDSENDNGRGNNNSSDEDPTSTANTPINVTPIDNTTTTTAAMSTDKLYMTLFVFGGFKHSLSPHKKNSFTSLNDLWKADIVISDDGPNHYLLFSEVLAGPIVAPADPDSPAIAVSVTGNPMPNFEAAKSGPDTRAFQAAIICHDGNLQSGILEEDVEDEAAGGQTYINVTHSDIYARRDIEGKNSATYANDNNQDKQTNKGNTRNFQVSDSDDINTDSSNNYDSNDSIINDRKKDADYASTFVAQNPSFKNKSLLVHGGNNEYGKVFLDLWRWSFNKEKWEKISSYFRPDTPMVGGHDIGGGGIGSVSDYEASNANPKNTKSNYNDFSNNFNGGANFRSAASSNTNDDPRNNIATANEESISVNYDRNLMTATNAISNTSKFEVQHDRTNHQMVQLGHYVLFAGGISQSDVDLLGANTDFQQNSNLNSGSTSSMLGSNNAVDSINASNIDNSDTNTDTSSNTDSRVPTLLEVLPDLLINASAPNRQLLSVDQRQHPKSFRLTSLDLRSKNWVFSCFNHQTVTSLKLDQMLGGNVGTGVVNDYANGELGNAKFKHKFKALLEKCVLEDQLVQRVTPLLKSHLSLQKMNNISRAAAVYNDDISDDVDVHFNGNDDDAYGNLFNEAGGKFGDNGDIDTQVKELIPLIRHIKQVNDTYASNTVANVGCSMVYSNKRVFKVGGILLHDFPLFKGAQENQQQQVRKREEKRYKERRQEQPKQREVEYESQDLSPVLREPSYDNSANYNNGAQITEPQTEQASRLKNDSTYRAGQDVYDIDSDSDSCQNNDDKIVGSKGCFLTVQTLEIPVLSQDGVIVDEPHKEFVLSKCQ